jgi:hypothetical protein
MLRPYRNIGFFFLILFALVVAGFTPRVPGTPFFGYFGQLAGSASIPPILHVHAAIALVWFSLLTVQAFLIRANHVEWHRWLGKASLIVAAAFLITAVQVMKHFYANAVLGMPRSVVLSALAQSFTALTLFVAFYVLALLRRRHLHQHVAFMVAMSLAVATPGLARLGLYVVGGLPGILLIVVLTYSTLAGFMMYAKTRFHQAILKSPYLIAIALFLLAHCMDFVGSRSAAWLWFADKLVGVW